MKLTSVLEGDVHLPVAFGLGAVAAPVHAAEAQKADVDFRPSERAILHGILIVRFQWRGRDLRPPEPSTPDVRLSSRTVGLSPHSRATSVRRMATTTPGADLRLCINRRCSHAADFGPAQGRVVDRRSRGEARAVIARWPGYVPTPLVDLPDLAARLGVRSLRVKHEARRFGLNSFKALGGAYGVMRVLERETGTAMDAR